MSLYDLIYSQPSDGDNDDVQQNSQGSKNDLVKDFYTSEASSKKKKDNKKNPVREKTATKKTEQSSRKENPSTERTDFKKAWRYIDLSAEERREVDKRRTKSRIEQGKWIQIRNRWKNKKYNFQDEIDYGGAVETVTARVGMKRKAAELSSTGTNDKEQPLSSKAPSAVRKDVLDIDSSDDESESQKEETFLGSLLERTPREMEKKKPNVVLTQAERIKNMTFQEKGYSVPQNPDFTFGKQFNGVDAIVLEPLKIDDNTLLQQQQEESPDEGVTLTTLGHERPGCNTRHYFPWYDPFECPTDGRFFHERNFIVLAARSIVGGGDYSNEKLQNRLLHFLYRKSQRKVHQNFLILNQARNHAMDLALFYNHDWGKERQYVFQQLGLGRQHEKLGPPHILGRTLDPANLVTTSARYRRLLVNKYSKGELGRLNDQTSSEEPQVMQDNDQENEIEDQASSEGSQQAKQVDDHENIEMKIKGANRKKTDKVHIPVKVKLEDLEGVTPQDRNNPIDLTGDDESSVEEKLESPLSDQEEEMSQDEEMKTNIDDQSPQEKYGVVGFPVPTTDYVHTPGSTPPIPFFPLDETFIVFGPPDDTIFYNHTADIDHVISALTTSILLTRLGNGRLQNSTMQMQKAHQELKDYLGSLPRNICYDAREFGLFQSSRTPLVPLYSAVMGYCNFLANCGNFQHGHADFTRSNEINEDMCTPVMTTRPKASSIGAADTMNVVAENICNYLESHLDDIRLAPFSKPLFLTGITTIARQLPPGAAEIFSRTCNSNNFRTPFDLVKMTLEYIESNDLFLEDEGFEEEGQVNPGLLEIAFNKSARNFESCLEKDDSNPVTHCEWQLAALSGSLLLQSGNEIGGGARCVPSSKRKDSSFSQLFSQSSFATNQASEHGKRLQLSNFQKVRKQVMNCALKMINIVNEQRSQRAYLAMSSFLEWSEVIALIVGPSKISIATNGWIQARRLHAYHTVQWATREKSNAALIRIEELMRWDEVSVDPVLDIRATLVENVPNDLQRWKKLASALGPVGTECRCSAGVKNKQCNLCKRLRHGLSISHKFLQERKEKLGWWGTSRLSWWDTHLLHLPSIGTRAFKNDEPDSGYETPNFIVRVSSIVEKLLINELNNTSIDSFFYENKKPYGVGTSMDQAMDLKWLHYPEDESDSDEDTTKVEDHTDSQADDEDAENYFNSDLPSRFAEVVEQESHTPVDGVGMDDDEEATTFPQLSRSRDGQLLASICIKVFVTCHLHDVKHSIVTTGVWVLAKRLWEKHANENHDISSSDMVKGCDELRCLLWLSTMGLNVPQILFDMFQDMKETKKKRSREKKRKKREIS